jgi:hypothetical protein
MESRFRELLKKPSVQRRKEIYAIHRAHDPKVFALLCFVLRNDPSPVIRHEAAFLLGALRAKQAVRVLMKAVRVDKSDLVRHESIEALGDLGTNTKQVRGFLRHLCADINPFIIDTAEIALVIWPASET